MMKKSLLFVLFAILCLQYTASADYKIKIYNSSASSFQPGGEIALSVDGDVNTFYHSNWGGGGFPIKLTYNFFNASQLDYLIVTPRQDGGNNGKFGETEIWYATAAAPANFTKAMDYNFQFSDTARRIVFPAGLQNVAAVQIVVKTGRNNFASCAEMEFYSALPAEPGRNVYKAVGAANVADGKVAIAVTGGTASNFQPGENINSSYDGDLATTYHSDWDGGGFPITLTYQLANPDSLNLIEYYPRQDGGPNGLFGELDIEYSTQSAPDIYIPLGSYNFQQSSQVSVILLSKAVIKPSRIRFIVKSGKNDFASCAEMKFYKQLTTALIPTVFTDITCSALKADVTQATVDTMASAFYKNIAQALLNNNYQTEWRVQYHQPYPTTEKTAATLKTSTYSAFENPTGIAFEKGENIVVFVGDALLKTVQLKITDMVSGQFETSTYPLVKGINKITVANAGLGYISYYYDDWATLPAVKINVAGGTVNGYFDITKHTNTDWGRLLREAVYGSMDIVGKEVSLCYSVPALRSYTPDDGVSFVNLYDSIIHIEHEQMGLVKYNRMPKNRMFGATTPSGGWRAGGNIGAMFALDWGVGNVTGLDGIRNNIWGIAHEFGHINQIRPGLKWLGLTEVTNNIHSSWISHLLGVGNTRHRLETESTNDGYDNDLPGGRMNAFLNYGVVKGEPWQFQKGPDKMTDYENNGGDFFVRLTPLWQLMLYYQLAGKGNSWYKPDWYADVAEKVRNTDETALSNSQLQANFMKNTCDMVGEDLTDFFKKAGMLTPLSRTIDDYGVQQLIITQANCDEVIAYAAKYPKPASPVIYYLSMNSIDAYKNKAAITGTTGVGVALNGDQLTIDHQQWKNVAAFETYDKDELLRASIYGAGSTDNSFTTVQLPVANASVYAVGWDGTKKLVYPIDGALPINFINIQAKAKDKAIDINWNVFDGQDISYYEIEKSTYLQHYQSIGRTKAVAGSNTAYTYTDINVVSNQTFYYRIKAIDVNGGIQYSEIIHAKIGLQKSLKVYPVLFDSQLIVELPANQTIKQIKLVGVSGLSISPTYAQRGSLIEVKPIGLPSGAYILQLVTAKGQTYIQKVIKK